MNWAAVILAAFKAISAALDFLERNRMIDAAEAAIFSRYAKGALNEIKAANDVRAAVRSELNAHPERLRDDDGFRRHD